MAGAERLVLAGDHRHCRAARYLSLLPGNRTEATSLDLIWRTFLSAPVKGNVMQGLPPAR
ncbi:MAG: hypothetical protein P8076_05515 [Gammaproteobacteria bacterium]